MIAIAGILSVSSSLSAQSISVEVLADKLVSEDIPFLIDLRRSHEFEKAHIPNAVNIPLVALGSRNLPPLGEVVVYGDGMGRIDAAEAVAMLEDKPGLQPFYLEGGFAAWQTRSGITTQSKGLSSASTGKITYQTLMDNQGEGVVIYDLRKGPGIRDNRDSLLEHFPRARMGAGSPYRLLRGPYAQLKQPVEGNSNKPNPLIRKGAKQTDQLIVLIDDDNESADAMARRLQAGGLKRVAVLVGGDTIIRHQGRSGLSRQGGLSMQIDPANPPSGTSKAEEDKP